MADTQNETQSLELLMAEKDALIESMAEEIRLLRSAATQPAAQGIPVKHNKKDYLVVHSVMLRNNAGSLDKLSPQQIAESPKLVGDLLEAKSTAIVPA